MASNNAIAVAVQTTLVNRIINRREKDGVYQYKVSWLNPRRSPSWHLPSSLDCPDLIEAFDANLLRLEMEKRNAAMHEAKKTENMEIVDERADGKVLVQWSGSTWEPKEIIPPGVLAAWEDKLLESPEKNK